jgi:hypothetical protein
LRNLDSIDALKPIVKNNANIADRDDMAKISKLLANFHKMTDSLPIIHDKRIIPLPLIGELIELLSSTKILLGDISLVNDCKSRLANLVENTVSDEELKTLLKELDELGCLLGSPTPLI